VKQELAERSEQQKQTTELGLGGSEEEMLQIANHKGMAEL
jgi:hypothetical protein